MRLLTDEEIRKAICSIHDYKLVTVSDEDRAIAKAQASLTLKEVASLLQRRIYGSADRSGNLRILLHELDLDALLRGEMPGG